MEPIEPLMGSDEADDLPGTPGPDLIYAYGGDDTVHAYGGSDVVYGGRHLDTLWGEGGDDTLFGGVHRDTLYGGEGFDHLFGGSGNDELRGGDDDDQLEGGSGADTLYGGNGSDELYGGVHYKSSLAPGLDGHNVLYGGAGSDALTIRTESGGTADAYGGTGNDKFYTDLTGVGSKLFGGADVDRLVFNLGVGGPDPGVRIVLNADLTGSVRQGSTMVTSLQGFEQLAVSAGDGDDVVRGRGGADYIGVDGGRNSVNAGAGNDVVVAHLGEKGTYLGGDGTDRLSLHGLLDAALNLDLKAGTDGFGSTIAGFERFWVDGAGKVDMIRGADGADQLSGNGGNDLLWGRGGADTLEGSVGADSLYGGNGADVLKGEDDVDQLFGGEGNDSLIGGNGADQLTGGAGADEFRFSSGELDVDILLDFQTGVDHLKFAQQIVGGSLPFGVVDASRLSHESASTPFGQFILKDLGSYDSLLWDANGATAGEQTELVRLSGESNLQASDILIG